MTSRQPIIDRPIRVIVWGPGQIGGGCIREILKLPEFELVGVLAFSSAKHGLDAGEMVGMAPIGVKVTCDKQEIFALEADCVLHASVTTAPEEMDEDVIRLLESGKSVISATAYHFPPLKGQDYNDRLEAACRKGNACLHGTGIHPNFFAERLGLTLTGICNRVNHITFKEYVNTSRMPETPLRASLGYGAAPESFKPGNQAYENTQRYYRESLLLTGYMLFGKVMERIDYTPTVYPAKGDIQLQRRSVKDGTIAEFKHVFVGYLDGEPKLTIEEYWYIGDRADGPCPQASADDFYVIDIDAEPCSVHMELGYTASFEQGLGFWPDDPTPPPFYATAVTMVQAVPLVCAAPAGIVYPKVWAHFAGDLRTLATDAAN